MSDKNSTMSPKRLFILLCLAGLLMFILSRSKVEVDISMDPNPDKTEEVKSLNDDLEEEVQQEKKPTQERKKKIKREKYKKNRKSKTDKVFDYTPQSTTGHDDRYLDKRK